MNKVMQFDAAISNVQKLNPLFSKCDIRVMYQGANRNNSFISRQTVDNAQYSIYNIPIVGEWKESVEDFGSHGGKVEISDAGVKFVQTTKPYGVVPSEAKVYWQPIAEADGTVREYLIVEGAYLWTGRYPEATDIISNTKGQSMEIEVLDGYQDQNGLMVISDLVFSALCILGNDVEPCFESANINAYSIDKNSFKQEFTAMMKELKASLNQDVENNGKEVEIVDEAEKVITAELTADENQEQAEVFEADVEVNDTVESASEEVVEEVVETAEEVAVVEVEAVQAEEVSEVAETIDYAAQYEVLLTELADLRARYDAMVAEKDELFAYKQNAEKESHGVAAEELFVQFDKLDEEEIQQVRAEMFNLSLEQIEEKLYFMLGKKLAQFSTTAKKTETVKVAFSASGKEKETQNGYELTHLFEKYTDK